MWTLTNFPESSMNFILVAGILLWTFGILTQSFLSKLSSVISKYSLVAQILGAGLLIAAMYIKGTIDSNTRWQIQLLKEQQKIVEIEKKAREINAELSKKINEQTEVVYLKGDTIYQYIDREVVKNKEVIKFVENCPLPSEIIEVHNAAATNTPIDKAIQ